MTKFTVVATKENEVIEKTYNMYHAALTTAINLQNVGYKVEVKRI